jgi:hypothetical protein
MKPLSVIPAQAGIQSHEGRRSVTLDPRLRGDDEEEGGDDEVRIGGGL